MLLAAKKAIPASWPGADRLRSHSHAHFTNLSPLRPSLLRYDEIMAKKAEQAAQSSAFPRPSDVREWMASLGSWMNPGSSPQGPSPFQDPTSSSGTSNSSSSSSSSGRSTSDSSGGRSSSSSSSSSSKRQGTPVESEQFQGGAGPAQPSPSTPVLSSPLLTSSSFLGGASLLGWFSSPVAALSRVLEQVGTQNIGALLICCTTPLQDLNRLEEEAVIAEAQRIAAGEEGEPTPGAGLASFVGRLPLEIGESEQGLLGAGNRQSSAKLLQTAIKMEEKECPGPPGGARAQITA
eukprot:1156772-Pelagomonas_calceolata.AAC.16